MGKDKVKIMLNGFVWKLRNVRHIFDLTENLISIGHLASDDYTTVFHRNGWKISKGGMEIAHSTKSSIIYKTV